MPTTVLKPFQVSVNTLKMMDTSMENFNKNLVSEPIDFSTYTDIE